MNARDVPEAGRTIRLDSVGSTNDVARDLARDGTPDLTIVLAREQKGGRGRRGRPWRSPPGNLYSTTVLQGPMPASVAAQAGFVAAVALAEAIDLLSGGQAAVTLKWPNDVLLNGGKVAGILLESSGTHRDHVDWLIIGLGVNIASAPVDTPYRATSLRAEGLMRVTPEIALDTYFPGFVAWRERWRRDGFGPVREAWLQRAQGLGQAIEVRIADRSVRGLFVTMDDSGALVIEDEKAKRQTVAAGEIFFAGG